MAKTVQLRALADADIDAALAWYTAEAPHAAARFLQMLESTIKRIGASPNLGSALYAVELQMPGLRHRKLPKFPYLVFYFENEAAIDIVRVLHAHRDLPSDLAASDP